MFDSYYILSGNPYALSRDQKLNWDVSQVRNMDIMFLQAKSFFNVYIGNWNVSNVLYFQGFRRGCPIRDAFTPDRIRYSQGGGR